MSLRIGVNALYLLPGGVGGTEIYLRSLLSALAAIDPLNDYFVFTNRETGSDLIPTAPNFHARPQSLRATSRPARILWEQAALPPQAAQVRLDVLLNPGFTAPVYCPCPQVTVFHDLQHWRHPEHFRWFDLPFWRVLLFASAQISTALIAVSEATRRDVLAHYRLPEKKVTTVLSGVDEAFFEIAERRRPERFLLSVSTLHPHKNLDGLLRAFANFRCVHPEYRLVVPGLHGFYTEALHELRDRLGLRDCVEFPGWIPRQDLYDLFARADAFIYPSRFEGFGLPVVEALAAGVPTACSNIEPISSNTGGAVLRFDPGDTDAMCAAMLLLVSDAGLRAKLTVDGARKAREFSWISTARSTLDVLNNTAFPANS
jgi:glycosyltransferase involved in cell wall biosynthesis